MKAGFVSLGCAKNLVDTEVMLGILAKKGIEITEEYADADILIVNTCGFIDAAKKESIDTILDKIHYKKHGKCKGLIVAGCLVQRYHEELFTEIPEVDVFIGSGAWQRIAEAVDIISSGQRAVFIEELTTLYNESTPRIPTTPEHSVYIKIADGCNNCCSYCVIPSVRGGFRSRKIESVVSEVQQLVNAGVREINLIAQDTTSYGRDCYGTAKLNELLAELVRIDDLKWIRLLYCYPKYFTDELIDTIAREEKICNYIDLPLQHSNQEVLQAMNRKDTRQEIENLIEKIRSRIPGVAIRTSFIVGFPGETSDQFDDLRQFMLKYKFDHVGVFTYSQEEGTPAGSMSCQIPDEVKQERYHELMAIQSKISEEINCELEGKEFDILIEDVDLQAHIVKGRSYREAPDVDGHIYIENALECKSGEFIKAKIDQGFVYDLVAVRQIASE